MTVYYVDGVDGADGNAGTSEGSGNAWATIDKAMNTVAAGDKVWVKGNGNYVETATLDTAGTSTTPIVFEGYTTTTGDNGKATIAPSTGSCLGTTINGNTFYVFHNFIFDGTNGSSNAVSTASDDYTSYWNCEFANSSGAGITADNYHAFYFCEFYNNTTQGVTVDNNAIFVGCTSYNNGGEQIDAAVCDLMYKCVIYGSTGGSDAMNGNMGYAIGNTIDGENTATVGISSTTSSGAIMDNVIYDCATGVTVNATGLTYRYGHAHNLLNSNTTDYSNTPTQEVGYQDVTSAPAFIDEAGDDYRLTLASGAVDAGLKPGGIT
jgi:hypothetical protein